MAESLPSKHTDFQQVSPSVDPNDANITEAAPDSLPQPATTSQSAIQATSSSSQLSDMLDQILSDMKSKAKNTTAEDTISKANPRNMQKEKDISVKAKTEAANPYLQFLSDRRRKANGVPLKLKQLQDDWRKMSKAEKQVHVDKFNMEKAELGSNFRKDRKKHKKVRLMFRK